MCTGTMAWSQESPAWESAPWEMSIPGLVWKWTSTVTIQRIKRSIREYRFREQNVMQPVPVPSLDFKQEIFVSRSSHIIESQVTLVTGYKHRKRSAF